MLIICWHNFRQSRAQAHGFGLSPECQYFSAMRSCMNKWRICWDKAAATNRNRKTINLYIFFHILHAVNTLELGKFHSWIRKLQSPICCFSNISLWIRTFLLSTISINSMLKAGPINTQALLIEFKHFEKSSVHDCAHCVTLKLIV